MPQSAGKIVALLHGLLFRYALSLISTSQEDLKLQITEATKFRNNVLKLTVIPCFDCGIVFSKI